MSNTYRALTPMAEAVFAAGEFEHEFSEDDEAAHVKSGLIEIVPRTYKVVGDSDVFEAKTGETFDAALTVHVEGLLIGGGFIERVEAEKAPAKKAAAKKS